MVINLFGEPSVGKSTAASYIFSQLKQYGLKCELVSEFAKEKVFENNLVSLANQVFIFANQFYRLDNCYKHTDIVITDCPLPLACVYATNNVFSSDLEKLAIKCFNMYDNVNYMLTRNHDYASDGRIHTELDSYNIRMDIKNILDRNNIYYEETISNTNNYDRIVRNTAKKFGVVFNN